jgi:hypothetical protein
MEAFGKLKRRTTDLVESGAKNLPSMPKNLPSMPKKLPSMPKMPDLSNVHLPAIPQMPSRWPNLSSLTQTTSSMKGTWQHVPLPALARSSHSLDVVGGSAYLFGGEVESRRPINNDMHVITLPSSGAPADYYAVPAKPSSRAQLASTLASTAEDDEQAGGLTDPLDEVPLSPLPEQPGIPVILAPDETEPEPMGTKDKGKGRATTPADEVPSARSGHATAVIGSRILLFGGRSTASETLDEGGRVWVFETKTNTWTYLDPHHDSPVPPARSNFAAVATDKPRDFTIRGDKRAETWKEWAEGDSAEVGIPQQPIVGHVAETAADEEDAGFGTLIIHGGSLRNGDRTKDVWAFDVRSRIWKPLPDAPGPARAGPALAIAKGRLYRFGGYDGEREQGGQLDVLQLQVDIFDDRVSKGEIGVFAKGDWASLVPSTAQEGEAGKLIAEEWPSERSASGLEVVQGGGGREYLVLLCGERAPSSGGGGGGGGGHEAAGNFWDDAWAFQVPPEARSTASFTGSVWHAMGRKTGEGKWTRLTMGPYDEDEGMDAQGPGPRGWFATASMNDLEGGVVLFGGLNDRNRRLGDGWIFRFA